MEVVHLEALRALAEVPPEVLRVLAKVPVEVLRALCDIPPQAFRAMGASAGEAPTEATESGWTGTGAGELRPAIDHAIEVMNRSPFNVVGSLGQYLPKGQGWANIYIDSGGGGVDRLLETPDYKVAQALSVLGSEVRLAILRSLFQAPKTVAELVADLRLGTTGQAYHHLRELERVGAVESRDGKYHFNYAAYTRVYLTALLVAHDIGARTPQEITDGARPVAG
jgi:DNA-binding transcriptional ArsR family regulator